MYFYENDTFKLLLEKEFLFFHKITGLFAFFYYDYFRGYIITFNEGVYIF